MQPGDQTYVFGGRRWQRPGYAALAREIGRIELAAQLAARHCERLTREHLPDRGLRGIASVEEIEALEEVLRRLLDVQDSARKAVEPLRLGYSRPEPD